MADRVITVPQATQIATKIKNKFDTVNGRLNQLTTRLSEAEALLNITGGEGDS